MYNTTDAVTAKLPNCHHCHHRCRATTAITAITTDNATNAANTATPPPIAPPSPLSLHAARARRYEAQRINGVLRIHGGFLLGRRSIGVYRANTTTTAAAAAAPPPAPGLPSPPGPGVGVPFTVDNTTTPTPACVVASLSKTGPFDADWLIGVFDLVAEPRWGPTNTAANASNASNGPRLAVPKGYMPSLPHPPTSNIPVMCIDGQLQQSRYENYYFHLIW